MGSEDAVPISLGGIWWHLCSLISRLATNGLLAAAHDEGVEEAGGGSHLKRRREAEEAHGRGVKRR